MRAGEIVRLILYPAAAILLVLLYSLHWLCFNESGARLVVEQLANHIPGLSMRFDGGTLARGVSVRDLVYKTSTVAVSAKQMRVAVNLPSLIALELTVNSLEVNKLEVRYTGAPAVTRASPTGKFNLSMPVTIRNAQVDTVDVRINQAAPVKLELVETSLELQGATLSLKRFSASSGSVRLDGEGTLMLNAPFAFDSTFRFAMAGRSASPALMLHGRAHGDSSRIDVQASLPSPDKGGVTAVIEPERRRFNGSVDITRLALERLTGTPISLGKSRVQVSGAFDDYRYNGQIALVNPWISDCRVEFQGGGDGAGIRLGEGRIAAKDLGLAASARFLFASHTLAAQVSGNIAGKAVDATAKVTIPDVPRLLASGRVSVAGNALAISSTKPGQIDVAVDAPRLDQLDSRLAGELTGKGSFEPATGKYELSLSSPRIGLAGQILGGVQGHVENSPATGVHARLAVADVRSGNTALGGGDIAYTGAGYSAGKVAVDWRYRKASLHLQSNLAVEDGRVAGVVDSGILETAGQVWRLAASAGFSAGNGRITMADQCWAKSDSSLCLTGIDYSSNVLRFALQANSLALAGFTSHRLDLTANLAFGKRPLYRAEARGELEMPARKLTWQKLQLRLTGDGSRFRYDGSAAFVNPYVRNAQVSVKGTISSAGVAFDAFRLTGEDTAMVASGRYDIAAGHVFAKLSGKWLGRDLAGDADISHLTEKPTGKASLSVADNSLAVSLEGFDKLETSIAANDLSKVNPRWGGSVNAKGQYNGRDSSFSFEGTSPVLKLDAYRFTDLHVSGSGQRGGINASMSVGGSQYEGQPLGGGNLTIDGKISSAKLVVSMQLLGGEVNLHGALGYNKGALSGNLSDGDFTLGGQPWKLQRPFEFTAAAGVLVVGNNCWENADGHICLRQAHLAAEQGKLDLRVAHLPLEIDKPWFAPGVSIDGRLDATLSGSVDARSGKPVFQGSFALEIPAGRLGYQAKGTALPLNLHIDAKIKDNRLDGGLVANSPQGDRLAARIRMPNVLSPREMSGNASVDTGNLAVVAAFVPEVEKASGSLRALVSMDSLKPPLKANLSVKVGDHAGVDIPLAGIRLDNLSMTVSGDANKVLVNSSATSGNGRMTATGVITDLFSPDRKASLNIKGTRVTMLDRPDMKLVATPDLRLVYDGLGNLDILGHFEVDDGSFKMSELREQARTPSPDVVIVSGGQPAAPGGVTSLHLDVAVKQFNVNMYGLESGVEGSVLLTQEGMSPRRAQGTLNLLKGTYSRFGRKFDIEKGRLIFSGPLDNPLVDVVSSRTITNANDPNSPVTVSLALSGPANDIKSTITSSPPMSGANALSYLILGHPLATSTGSESQAVSGAALALGLKQALPITREIQSALGLSELTVSSTGVDSTSVVAGKRVGPNLYVEYDYDVFSRIGGILFNYHLTPRLSLETRTGEANSMQLIYNF